MKKLYSLLTLFLSTLLFSATAQTNVSGGIYAYTTWTLAGSPYIVVDTVVVFPGVTLTIDPGVVVKFDDGIGLELRQANLIAVGTVTDSITFTSNSSTPTPGICSKVLLNGGTAPSRFNYCNFKYAQYAINGGPVDTIRNSNFTLNT